MTLNEMSKIVLFVVALGVASFSQDAAYYTAIQKASGSTQVSPAQFKKMEENALKDFSRPESYELLATSFGNTTEKVWAVIYGEVYCNLSSNADRISQIGSLVYRWYEGSLSRKGNNLSANLTENAQSTQNQAPFESLFEQTYLMGAVGVKGDFPPLSIQRLIDIRKNQLSLWSQRKLPETELVRWEETILSAGHFEAYNYWLFKGARPEEFSEWSKNHKDQFQAWLDWRSKNPLRVRTPDFQRLYMLRKPGRSSTAPASLIHEAGRTASAILPTLQNTCASGDSKCNKQFDQHAKDLKKGLEDLQKKVDKMKDGAEKTKLQSSLKTLGTENDGNNVDVKFGSVAGWAGQVKDGHEGAPSRSNNSGRRSVRGGWNDIWRNIGNRASYEWFDRNRSGRHCWPC